ncbi:glycosyltransferase family 1 protein [Patescibacteria group bacterium]|nr:glycosyltransferase family 1 protein [Patescibacteria group bacterium]
MEPAPGLRIAIVTDAYFPHISGVATTLKATCEELEKQGNIVKIIAPRDFPLVIPAPTYPEIKLTLFPYKRLEKMLDEFKPDSIHVAVEGPLGLAARKYAKKRKMCYTTAYHTRFPEYVHCRTGIPTSWVYAFARWFHNGGSGVMVAAHSLIKELEGHGFKNLRYWPRGVDSELFNPENPIALTGERPIFMYMGRVSVEKNLDAFLSLDLPGTKYIVGDGPARKALEKKYPNVIFTGYKFGKELAQHVAAADVFVFPSLTDTLGLVMLEANACGVPVAALPSQASSTVIKEGENGIVSADLKDACLRALTLSRERARAIAIESGWKEPGELFLKNLVCAVE